ncbi:HPr family phosphocarrier protein [Caproiciproducens galactitolivorans]|jgi:phosphocarrier protein HPr|uniref:Phosphocarrier protein HPr n=1 Tax=Caproiciproducens galactitolivorans TaxID=642589 RepID=A0A4Z0YG67_9FIRM|nr:HPr family phosphocarrier protein [Caproiciproducens galactitolivorans]NLG93229.1 HPr family phosphocarrier protein [Clostridiales bacterium]QEY34798.1 HPr family phosphocarrier protein [Caproiciproducens galactitolivorans]TGJ75952.1 phosphocarrier protein HPr [Caproiciproducens galactitolivorans]
MKEFCYVITDPEGIHARPAGMLVKEAGKFTSSIRLIKNGKAADAKRIFSVMSLAAKKGETIQVTVDGPDEENAAAAIRDFLEKNL